MDIRIWGVYRTVLTFTFYIGIWNGITSLVFPLGIKILYVHQQYSSISNQIFPLFFSISSIRADIKAKCGVWIDAKLINLSDGLVLP